MVCRNGEDGIGLLMERGSALRKMNVQRILDESAKNQVKMRSVQAELESKSRKYSSFLIPNLTFSSIFHLLTGFAVMVCIVPFVFMLVETILLSNPIPVFSFVRCVWGIFIIGSACMQLLFPFFPLHIVNKLLKWTKVSIPQSLMVLLCIFNSALESLANNQFFISMSVLCTFLFDLYIILGARYSINTFLYFGTDQ